MPIPKEADIQRSIASLCGGSARATELIANDRPARYFYVKGPANDVPVRIAEGGFWLVSTPTGLKVVIEKPENSASSL